MFEVRNININWTQSNKEIMPHGQVEFNLGIQGSFVPHLNISNKNICVMQSSQSIAAILFLNLKTN